MASCPVRICSFLFSKAIESFLYEFCLYEFLFVRVCDFLGYTGAVGPRGPRGYKGEDGKFVSIFFSVLVDHLDFDIFVVVFMEYG